MRLVYAIFENTGDNELITHNNSLEGELSIRKMDLCVKKRPLMIGKTQNWKPFFCEEGSGNWFGLKRKKRL
jgi:hypothetical protein